MASSLTIIFFPYNLNTSIEPVIPSDTELESLIQRVDPEERKVTIYLVDPKIEIPKGIYNKNIIYLKNTINEWDGADNSQEYKRNTDLRHPIESIEGTVLVFCVTSEDMIDTYTIMEEFPTQRYENCLYIQWSKYEKNFLNRYFDIWYDLAKPSENSETVKVPMSPRLRPKQSNSFIKHYELYSGDKMDNTVDRVDRDSVYRHMILLCDYIRAYLRFGLMKRYNIEKMRELPESSTGYTQVPFFNDTQIDDMVKNSFYFQLEDPILKGFLLAHKICVAEDRISPLNVEIEIQSLIFNHGQFRRELLNSMIKVVANFCKNNGFLTKKDFTLPREVEKEEEEVEPEPEEEVKPTKKKNGVSVTKLKNLREIETTPVIRKIKPHAEFYTKELWDKVEKRLTEQLS